MMLPLLAALLVVPLQDEALPTVADAAQAGQCRVLGTKWRSHSAFVTSSDLAPGGALALSTGYDDSVRLWNTETGEAAGTLDGHGEVTFFADFLGDDRLVSAGDEGTLRVWDIAKAEVIKSHQIEAVSPRFGATSHDAKLLAFASGARVLVYDVGRMEEVDSLPALGASTIDIEFSPDDRYIAACGQGSGFLVVYDRDQGKIVGQLGTDHGALGLSFSPDGKRIAVSSGKRVLLWDIEGAQVIDQLTGYDEPVHAVRFSPDGKVVYFGTRFGQLHGVELESGESVFFREAHHAVVTGLQISRDGKQLLSSAGDGSLRFFDIATQLEVCAPTQPNDVVQDLAWSADGKTLFTASYDGRVDKWSVADGTAESVHRVAGMANSVCVVDGAPVAVSGEHLLGAGAQPLASFEDDDDAFSVVCAAGDGNVLVGLVSGGIELRSAKTGEVVREYVGHDDLLHAIELAPDGKRFASVSEDGTLRVFALGTEEPVFADEDASWDAIYGVAWIDDARLATVDVLGRLRVRDAETGEDRNAVTVEPGEDEEEVTSAAYDVVCLPDGRLVTSSDVGVSVWSAADQSLVVAIVTGDAIAPSLALSPDGKTVAAGLTTGTLVLWNVARLVK